MATTMSNHQQQDQQLPPPPYSKRDGNPIKPTDVSHLIHPDLPPPPPLNQASQQNEQDLVTAAQALTLLTKNATPPSDTDTIVTDPQSPLSIHSHSIPQSPNGITATTTTTVTNQMGAVQQLDHIPGAQQRHPFVSTVSMVAKHPIVLNAVKYYENSKRNYPSFNYAAGIVESAAIPVVNNIEAKLNTRYQTRQASVVSSSNDITPTNSLAGDYKIQSNLQKKRRFSNSSQSTTYSSIDTKKRLQFCINILKLANANISSKVDFLRQKINETEIAVKEEREKLNAQKSNEVDTTQKAKTEIVGTVKKIIHLISNFRPSSLGDTSNNSLTPVSSNNSSQTTHSATSNANNQDLELKNAIRDIILHLPQSLQQQNQQSAAGTASSQDDVIFKFAKESLVMISRLTQIFTEKLDQVETWVNGEEGEQPKEQEQTKLEQKLKDDEEEEHLAAETKRMKIDESR